MSQRTCGLERPLSPPFESDFTLLPDAKLDFRLPSVAEHGYRWAFAPLPAGVKVIRYEQEADGAEHYSFMTGDRAEDDRWTVELHLVREDAPEVVVGCHLFHVN